MAIRYLDQTTKSRIRYIDESPQKVSTKLFDDKFIKENKNLGIIIDVAGQTGSAFLNQLLAGIPIPLLKKAGIEVGKPITTAGSYFLIRHKDFITPAVIAKIFIKTPFILPPLPAESITKVFSDIIGAKASYRLSTNIIT